MGIAYVPMASGVLFRHDASREHDTGPGHPERIDRIVAIEDALAARDWLGWDVRDSPLVQQDVLERVHPAAHIEAIRSLSAAGGGWIDADTVVMERTYEAAARGAGGAVAMVDALVSGEFATGASLHRPPGHHAETSRAMGFCFFDSVAVAARHAVVAHGLSRVLVLDWDVHHGNGTNAIFHEDPSVLFVSIHQSPLYPGTGPASDVGSGAGVGWTVNLPVPPGSGDDAFVSLVEHVAAPLIARHGVQLVLISAGFDAHVADPLASCSVTDDGYAAMTASLRAAAGAVDAPVGVVLEGGYDLGALVNGTLATLTTLGADAVAAPECDVHPLAAAALDRLA